MVKRENVLTWDEYFMGLAHLSAFRSKDPSTQVGAVIVDESHRVVSIGYNGLPRGCSDDEFPWEREGDTLNTKYAYVVHGELNAILNSIKSLKGCTVYVTHFPCNECAKAIVQSKISRVIYLSDKHKDKDSFKASKRILENAGIKIEKISFGSKKIILDFDETNL